MLPVTVDTRRFEHTPPVVWPPSALCYATTGAQPATQGQRSKDGRRQCSSIRDLYYKRLFWKSDLYGEMQDAGGWQRSTPLLCLCLICMRRLYLSHFMGSYSYAP
jgi:hypothetical protein